MTDRPLCIVYEGATEAAARQLAQRTGLPMVPWPARPGSGLYLQYRDDRLVLGQLDNPREHPISVDFRAEALAWRRQRGPELLVKAVGGGAQRPTVLDATAGLGRDAFVLASHGYAVTLLERNAAVVALLEDGLARALHESATVTPVTANVVQRMRLLQADATTYLTALADTDRPDVIYLDPMFEASDKSALVKKEMRLFHALVGQDTVDNAALLELALAKAQHRVVVKRALKAPLLAQREPAFSVKGKAIRLDVYTLRAYDRKT